VAEANARADAQAVLDASAEVRSALAEAHGQMQTLRAEREAARRAERELGAEITRRVDEAAALATALAKARQQVDERDEHQAQLMQAAAAARARVAALERRLADAHAQQRVMAEVAAAELAAATHALRAVARSDLESAVEAVRRELSREHEVSLKAATETARVEAAMDSERQCRLRVDAEAALGTALDELTVARHELSRVSALDCA
jgi:chromosome segregation ATPase